MFLEFPSCSDFGGEYVSTFGAMVNVLSAAVPDGLLTPELKPRTVPPQSANEQSFVVVGVQVGDLAVVNPPGSLNGLAVAGVRVSGKDTLAITFLNPGTANATPPPGKWLVSVVRR
jgi:hypothetical protein